MNGIRPQAKNLGGLGAEPPTRPYPAPVCVGSGQENRKTGQRNPRIIRSAGALRDWLNAHPERDNPDAYLWGRLVKGKWRRIKYDEVRLMLQHAKEAAGIEKRVWPHLFRHCSITYSKRDRILTRDEQKQYYGFAHDTRQLDTYDHLEIADANNAMLRAYGMEQAPAAPRSRTCGMCKSLNVGGGRFCAQCGQALVLPTIRVTQERLAHAGNLVDEFLARPEIQEQFQRHLESRAVIVASSASATGPPGEPDKGPQPARPASPTPASPSRDHLKQEAPASAD